MKQNLAGLWEERLSQPLHLFDLELLLEVVHGLEQLQPLAVDHLLPGNLLLGEVGERDRLLGQAWRSGETYIPGRVAQVMTQARRRLDQICLAETDTMGRILGLRDAFARTRAASELADSCQAD